MELQNKHAIVTGSGHGIGREIALLLAANGASNKAVIAGVPIVVNTGLSAPVIPSADLTLPLPSFLASLKAPGISSAAKASDVPAVTFSGLSLM